MKQNSKDNETQVLLLLILLLKFVLHFSSLFRPITKYLDHKSRLFVKALYDRYLNFPPQGKPGIINNNVLATLSYPILTVESPVFS